MNERIDKLFEQALEEFKAENKYATIIVPNPLKEKFAELIVRECANICHKMAEDSDSYVVHDGDTCAEQIKKHFGVE
jgi:hypothetical protein